MDTQPAGFQPIDNGVTEQHDAEGSPPPQPHLPPPATGITSGFGQMPPQSPTPQAGWGAQPAGWAHSPAAPTPRRRTVLGLPWWAWGLIVGAVALVVVVVVVSGGDDSSEPAVFSAESSLPIPSDAVMFVDPQGDYTMSIGADWEPTIAMTKEIEQWIVSDEVGILSPNVNVLTQVAPGMNLQAYIDFSLDNMGGMQVVGWTIIAGNGADLGLVEYEGTAPGSTITVHALGVFGVSDGEAVVATFVASDRDFAELRAEVEPYMRTLVLL